MHSQLVVLGGGPGGYAAAFLAADHGMDVTIVEAEQRLGGTCLLRGCIPSKALLHVARVVSECQEMDEWGVAFSQPKIEIDKLRERKEKVISTLSGGLSNLAKQRKVNVINARGTFVDSGKLKLEGSEHSELTFDHCIIATGSLPTKIPAFDIGSDRVMDSTGALELKDAPESMLVIGGGYIGLEMATVYASLGTSVSVVELTPGLLPGADRDLVRPLQKRLEKGILSEIHLETKVVSLAESGDKIDVRMEGPNGEFNRQFDRVLVSVGRRPNTTGLGLENTKVKVSERGFIEHDDQMRTADEKLLVIGDAAGEPMLAHKATHEGKVAAEALLGQPAAFDKMAIPAVVFTDPEIAWTGITEEEAKQQGRTVEVNRYPWLASGRALSLGRTEGLTKVIVDPDTDRVLGVGIVGTNAGDLISEATLAIEMGCTTRDIAETIHPHPTLSETIGNVAEVFLGTATEIYRPRRK
ncbi:MAG: dihydrolipoyl dehydrogenase [Pirellulales bacterium]|nr:dihydrolipoyl dehydrogenase [Pirellulales bacterium]